MLAPVIVPCSKKIVKNLKNTQGPGIYILFVGGIPADQRNTPETRIFLIYLSNKHSMGSRSDFATPQRKLLDFAAVTEYFSP